MARKMKHKASRKNKGMKASKRRKAQISKPVGKKNKKANVRRREARLPLGEAFRSREELQKAIADSPDMLTFDPGSDMAKHVETIDGIPADKTDAI